MNYFKKIMSIQIFVLTFMLLFSCGAKHHLIDNVVYKDDNFTYNHLKDNGIIVGGLSSPVVELSRKERIEYGSIISNILVDKMKDVHTINIINTIQLVDKLGKEKYFEIMENFDEVRMIKRENIQLIRDSIPYIKFMLLTSIENENIIDKSYQKYIEVEEEKTIETEYVKTYLLTINFQIYDIFQEKMVWHNVIYNQAENSETRSTRTGCFESCMDDIIQTILFGSPAEIDRKEVLAKTVEKFVKDLGKT
jgi:hypothetical protein